MAELVEFVRRGAARVTPQVLRGVYKRLPVLRMEFTQIDAPKFPRLIGQLQFLCNILEDFVDGKADELPYVVIAASCYALIYVRKGSDLIPDSIPDFGMSDDSGVVRVVLIEYERILAQYAEKLGMNWHTIGTEP